MTGILAQATVDPLQRFVMNRHHRAWAVTVTGKRALNGAPLKPMELTIEAPDEETAARAGIDTYVAFHQGN